MGYDLIRAVTEELAERWELGGNLYFLRLDELDGYRGRQAELRAKISSRRTRREALKRIDVGEIIDSAYLDSLGVRPRDEAGETLEARPVAAGSAEGVARVVFAPDEADRFDEGDILVCPSTDPGWTPLFIRTAALVVERGGVLSHGAIVARDFGIPAVVCRDATRLIRQGDRIHVDDHNGRITIIAPEGER